MSQTSDKVARVSAFKPLRDIRDAALGRWAKIALAVTSSGAYSRTSAVLTRPGLVVLALARGKAEQLMAQLLSELNMPSRADVLSLSIRLTHIEAALDDLGAAVDELRASAPRATAARRAPRRNRNGARAAEVVEP